jgi:putative holliday junction resolvase
LPDFQLGSPHGRILALDVGKKRIGLAVSDALGISAQGMPTFQRVRIRDDLRRLKELVAEHDIQLLLIGKPLHMSGTASRQSVYTEEFGERLKEETGIPVVYWDERLTTVEAERVLREGNVSLDKRKQVIDRLAAVLLLESYLDAQRYRRGEEE